MVNETKHFEIGFAIRQSNFRFRISDLRFRAPTAYTRAIHTSKEKGDEVRPYCSVVGLRVLLWTDGWSHSAGHDQRCDRRSVAGRGCYRQELRYGRQHRTTDGRKRPLPGAPPAIL